MENNTFLCSLCGSSFRERWELQSHNKKVHDKRVFKCEICTKEVIGQIKMVSHKQIHKKKACEICWKQIPLNSFGNHRAKCEGIILHCDLCQYETPKKQFLQKHVASIHKEKPKKVKETKTLPCPHCKKMFTPKNLNRHVKIHSALKNIACNLCGKWFADCEKLKAHMKTVHLEKKITTEEGHSAVFETDVPKPKEQQYVCDICSYSTTKNFNFSKHLKIHLKEKMDHPTKCDQCEYTSSHRGTLARHIANTKHKGISKSTQYRKMQNMDVPKSNYKSFKHTTIEPEIRVLGEEDVIKLVEDMNCSQRDLMKAIKWVRYCLGSKHVVKGVRKLIEKHLRRLEDDHEVEPVIFKDKEGNDKLSSLAKVKDLPPLYMIIHEKKPWFTSSPTKEPPIYLCAKRSECWFYTKGKTKDQKEQNPFRII